MDNIEKELFAVGKQRKKLSSFSIVDIKLVPEAQEINKGKINKELTFIN